MKALALAALALDALTSVAMAGPVQLTDEQMDKIVAGNCGTSGCDVGGNNNGHGVALVQHHHSSETNVADICTPGLCDIRDKPGRGDTHVKVSPKNSN